MDVVTHRLPILDERSPLPSDFDLMCEIVKGVEWANTALIFNCQMGKGRTTTGMCVSICVCVCVCVCVHARLRICLLTYLHVCVCDRYGVCMSDEACDGGGQWWQQ